MRGTSQRLPTSSPVRASAVPPVVIYLAGSGRSGSTLLERTLGAAPGFVNVGELIDLFRRVASGDELCGCGAHFHACPFWRDVGKAAFGGWGADVVAEVATLQGRVARQRHLVQLLWPRSSRGFTSAGTAYRTLYSRLYRAVLEVSGAQYVVDASKWPAQAMALNGPEIDLRVIHVVRDIHGVAHSMGKRQVTRPHATSGTSEMMSSGTLSAAMRWSICQLETDLIRVQHPHVAEVAYEDLVRSPRRCIQTALRRVQIVTTPHAFDHVADDGIHISSSHGLSGNPSRFQNGFMPLRPDEAWRWSMTRRRRVIVSAIGTSTTIIRRLAHTTGAPVEPCGGDVQ